MTRHGLWSVGFLLGLGSCALVGGLDGNFVLNPGAGGSSASSATTTMGAGAGGSESTSTSGGKGNAGGGSSTANWAYTFGDQGKQYVAAIAPTADGGVIVLGTYYGKLSLGARDVENKKTCNQQDGSELIACGDVYVMKLDKGKNLVWVQSFASDKEQGILPPFQLDLNPKTEEAIVHFRCQSLKLNISSQAKTLATSGLNELCMIKLNPMGEVTHAEAWGGDKVQIGPGVTTEAGILITAYISQTEINRISFNKGVHLLRFSYDLNFASRTFLYDSDGAVPHAITTDQENQLYISGDFSGSITWPDQSKTTTVNHGGTESFISSWKTDGTFLWHDQSTSTSQLNAAAPSSQHNALVVWGEKLITAGTFLGEVNLGDGPLTNASDPNCLDESNQTGNCPDGFVAIYNRFSGAMDRSKHLESAGIARFRSIDATTDRVLVGGNIFAANAFLSGQTLTNNAPGKSQVLLVELAPEDLSLQRHAVLGSLESDVLTSLGFGSAGRIWAGGIIRGTTELSSGIESVVNDPPDAFILTTDAL